MGCPAVGLSTASARGAHWLPWRTEEANHRVRKSVGKVQLASEMGEILRQYRVRCATGVAGWKLTGIRQVYGRLLGGGAAAGAIVTLCSVAGCGGVTAGGGYVTLGGGVGVKGRSAPGGGFTCGSVTTLGSGGGGAGGGCVEVLGAPDRGRDLERGGGMVCALHFLKSSRRLVISVGCLLCSVADVSFTAKDRELRA